MPIVPFIQSDIISKDVLIYPSANALDGGQINSEENLSLLSNKFSFESFVVRKKNEIGGLAVSHTGTTLNITKGRCFIEGKTIAILDDLEIDLTNITPNIFERVGTKHYIYLQLHKDASGCVEGDKLGLDNITYICGGITVTMAVTSDTVPYSLLLGSVTATSASAITTEDYDSKYCILDISQVGMDGTSIQQMIADAVAEAMNSQAYISIIKDTTKDPLSPVLYLIDKTGNVVNNKGYIQNTGSGIKVYYINNSTNKESYITIDDTGVIYSGDAVQSPATSLNIISKLYDLESRINSGGVNVAPENGTISAIDGTTTSNGTKTNNVDLLARANHAHTQYIKGTRNTDGSQSISTRLNVSTLSASGNINATGTITANKVYNAVWNDYADAVLKADGTETEPGDIIAKDEYSDGYVLATSYNAKLVVGVHSDTYGHLLGATADTLDKYIPIALAGNVKVKVVGKIKIGDFIVASFIPGVGVSSTGYVPGTIVGKALENKDTDDVSRILMQVMLI